MFRSPLKTVTEKIKPTQSKSGISSLKFERVSDFKKFIGFIKTETKELEKIKLPKETEIKPKKKRGGILGLLGLGLLGVLGGGFGGGGDDESNERTSSEGGTPSQFNTGIILSRNLRRPPVKLVTKKPLKNVVTKKRQNVINRRRDRDKARKARRERRITKTIEKNNQKFKDEFIRRKKKTLENARVKLGIPLDDQRFSDFDVEQILNQDMGLFPGELDQKLADKITKDFKKKGIKFEDALDPRTRARVQQDLFIDDFLNKINTPINLDDIEFLKKIASEKDIPLGQRDKYFVNLFKNYGAPTADAKEAQEILNSPEVKRIIKEDKFQKIAGADIDTPKATSFFKGKFTPKYVLDDIFTGIGEKTKPLRNFFTPVAKNIAKTKIPFAGNISLLGISRGLGKVFPIIDAAGAVIALNDLGLVDFSDGILKPKVGRDNIVTGLYDLFTSFYNAGVEGLGFDDANKRLFISKSRDKRMRAFDDARNKEILEAREAKKLRDAVNMNFNTSNFNTSMLNNSSTQLPKSTPFSVQKVDGGEFNPPFDYSDMGTIDFSSAAILYKLNK